MAMVRGADVLAESLIGLGVDTIFGVPGDTGVVFYDALHAVPDQLRHVLARDERHAAAMADGYARVSGRVGAVEVSSGGGTTYVVGGMGEAMASGVPVLLITSDIHRSSRGSGALTEIDQLALFSAVTKHSAVVEHAADIPAMAAQAVRAATEGRPGPVALIFPEDVFDELVERETLDLGPAASRLVDVPGLREAAQADRVTEAAHLLAGAERPAIMAGSGVHSSQAWSELAELAETGAIPVATTIHGRGVIADTDNWALGVVGNNGGRPYANEYLASADVVLLVGTRANATDTNSWQGPAREGTAVIQIDIDEDRAGRNFPGAVRLVGDARTVLSQILAELPKAADDVREARAGGVVATRTAWREQRDPVDLKEHQLLPRDVVELVDEVLGGAAVWVADPGTPTPNVATYRQITTPGRDVIIPRGHGPMGYAIPAAVGISVAVPDRPVVSVTADGSFAMACGELETVSRLDLPILYLQFTNHSLGWIKMLQHLYVGQRYFGVDPGTIDAVKVAEGCGLRAERVATLERLRELVAEFARNPQPLYLDIEVPHMIDVLPPVPAWQTALDGDAERPVY
ncbi:thiamine pyrophosphate-binding protein [Ornithinimicrobium cavernae]|uniref:thiamine pyrophosphate-binding protein n=1 Tax=Ornithinimicrobium cavernae TaxID=2666047 RepID=UPI00137B4EAF|nr:thiamine pyrophosphate-binding protein [Ornithinimicrobium cavernae]